MAYETSPSGSDSGKVAFMREEGAGLPQEEVQRRSGTMGLLQTAQVFELEQPI